MIPLFQKVTSSNFNATAYLLANADLRSADVNPEKHFQTDGHDEGRSQINLELIMESAYRKRKFDRFINYLDVPEKRVESTFPLAVTGTPLDVQTYQTESANASFGPFIAELESHPDRNYLDIGCGLRHEHYDNCLYIEVYPSISADIICAPDGKYPILSNSMDGIGCFAVLEHVRKPWMVVEEIWRILKPSGRVFIDWPFLQPIHGFPSHYFNATRHGLESIFVDVGFRVDELRTYPFQGPNYTIDWVLGKFIRDLPPDVSSEIANLRVKDLIELCQNGEFWEKILRQISDRTMSEFACGNCLIATKT